MTDKYPIRDDKHIIDEKGQNLVRSLLPEEWHIHFYNSREYGTDFEVEIPFRNSKNNKFEMRGNIFKGQLKTHKNVKIRKGSYIPHYISQHIEYKNWNNWINIPSPFFLFIADLESQKIFWLNVKKKKGIEITNKSGTSIRIPIINEVSIMDSIKKLKQEAISELDIIRTSYGIKPGLKKTNKGIIWVEGHSDRIYIKMLLECFNIDLKREGILISPYNGRDNLLNEYHSLSLLKNINNRFLIITDSDKSNKDNPIGQKLLKIKQKFSKAGYLFSIIENYRDIEGFLPQNIINEYFHLPNNLSNQNKKGSFEKLEDYITRLKNSEIIEVENPKYEKMRDSEKISKLILKNKDYKNEIKNNPKISSFMKDIIYEIKKWSNEKIKINQNFYGGIIGFGLLFFLTFIVLNLPAKADYIFLPCISLLILSIGYIKYSFDYHNHLKNSKLHNIVSDLTYKRSKIQFLVSFCLFFMFLSLIIQFMLEDPYTIYITIVLFSALFIIGLINKKYLK